MAMTKLMVHLPEELKAKLDGKRAEGFTLSGYIRALLERELNHEPAAKIARKAR